MRWVLVIFLMILLLSASGSVSACDNSLAIAKRHFDAGRLIPTVSVLNRLLNRRPSDVAALRLRALAECGLGKFDEAIRDYERILRKQGDDLETQKDLGMLLAFKKRDVRGALVHLSRYLSIAVEKGKRERLMRTVRIMKTLDHRHSRREGRALKDLQSMAETFESIGNERIALKACRRVLKISPTCAACHAAIGRFLLHGHRRDEAGRQLIMAQLFQGESG